MTTKLTDLQPDNLNANLGTETGNALLRQNLRRNGAGRSILIDRNNRIIAGNKTTEGAIAEGIENVLIVDTTGDTLIAVRRTDLDLDSPEGREMALADNKIALANILFDQSVIDTLSEDFNVDLALLGFAEDTPPPTIPVADPERLSPIPTKARTKPGDRYELNGHTVLCADARESSSIENLLNGIRVDLCFTDPPYGVSIVKKSSKTIGSGGMTKFKGKPGEKARKNKRVEVRQYATIKGDDTTDTARTVYAHCQQIKAADAYIIFGGNYFTDFLKPSKCWLIWDKQINGDFGDVEMAWTSFNKAPKLYQWLWNGLSRKGDRATELTTRIHATQKPVGMLLDILKDFPASTILDPFLGSGSTLIAAEKNESLLYGIEYEPAFVDLIVDRYIRFITANNKPVIAKLNGLEISSDKLLL